MQIKIDPSALRQTKWHQYVVRFVFGGLITAIAGVIAKKYGAGVGGLFLAFPAIFPASATLIEKHEQERKQKHGLEGTERGREAASVDAAGSAMGSIGLLVFAPLVWQFMPSHKIWLVLPAATLSWLCSRVVLLAGIKIPLNFDGERINVWKLLRLPQFFPLEFVPASVNPLHIFSNAGLLRIRAKLF